MDPTQSKPLATLSGKELVDLKGRESQVSIQIREDKPKLEKIRNTIEQKGKRAENIQQATRTSQLAETRKAVSSLKARESELIIEIKNRMAKLEHTRITIEQRQKVKKAEKSQQALKADELAEIRRAEELSSKEALNTARRARKREARKARRQARQAEKLRLRAADRVEASVYSDPIGAQETTDDENENDIEIGHRYLDSSLLRHNRDIRAAAHQTEPARAYQGPNQLAQHDANKPLSTQRAGKRRLQGPIVSSPPKRADHQPSAPICEVHREDADGNSGNKHPTTQAAKDSDVSDASDESSDPYEDLRARKAARAKLAKSVEDSERTEHARSAQPSKRKRTPTRSRVAVPRATQFTSPTPKRRRFSVAAVRPQRGIITSSTSRSGIPAIMRHYRARTATPGSMADYMNRMKQENGLFRFAEALLDTTMPYSPEWRETTSSYCITCEMCRNIQMPAHTRQEDFWNRDQDTLHTRWFKCKTKGCKAKKLTCAQYIERAREQLGAGRFARVLREVLNTEPPGSALLRGLEVYR